MELINNSLCPARLVLSPNVVLVSLEPFWYPMETDQFRTQSFASDHLRRSCSSVCICAGVFLVLKAVKMYAVLSCL